jgi:TRAP-type C4-dicarboxylate transport system permease small subunit
MKKLERILAGAEQACLVFCVLTVGAMIGINAVQIFFRYVFNLAAIWVFPLTMLLFIWMTFLGAFVIYRRKKDIVVSFILNLFPAAGRKAIVLLTNLLTMALLVWILVEFPMIIKSQAADMEVIPLPRYTQAVPLFIGIFGILLQYVMETVALLKNSTRSN